MFERLKTSKTAWTAIGGALGAAYMAYGGTMTWNEAMPIIWAAIALVFLRDGVAKTPPPTT